METWDKDKIVPWTKVDLGEPIVGYGYFGGYYIDDDNDKPRDCNYHRLEERELFGVHTYFHCTKCDKTFNFGEVNKYDDIVKRITMHPMPWEKT